MIVRLTGITLICMLMYTLYTDARMVELAAVPEQKREILNNYVLSQNIS